MYPFISIGQLKIPAFSLMGFLGLVAFVLLTILIVEKIEKTDRKTVNRLLIVCAVGFAVLYSSAFVLNSLFHSIEQKRIVIGGITWLGGVLVALPVMVVLTHFLCPRAKGHALFLCNLLVPAITLAHAFGRVGCFLGGCCYGGVTESFLGISFPAGSLAASAQYHAGLIGAHEPSLPVFPTQLFEAVFELSLFLFMILTYKKLKGHFMETYCFGYGTFRFFIEFLRGDSRGETGLFLSPSQLMSILLIVLGILLILYHKRVIFKGLHDKMRRYREETALYGVHLEADIQAVNHRLQSLQKDGLISDGELAQMQSFLESRQAEKPSQEEPPSEE